MSEPVQPPQPGNQSPLRRYAAGMADRFEQGGEPTQPAPTPNEPPTPPEPEATEAPDAPEVDETGEPAEAPETEPEGEATEPTPDGEEPEPEAATDETDETVYTVRVQGEEFEVPASELVAGYQRNRDYQQKTQRLAAQRKEHEAAVEQFAGQQQQIAQQWRQTGEYLLAEVRGISEQDFTRLAQEDPEQYQQTQQWIESRKQLAQQVMARAHEEEQQAVQRRLPIEKSKLVERLNESKIPIAGKPGDWSDAEQFDRGYRALTEWAVGTAGIAPERWNRTVDHVEVWIVAKAMAHDLEARERPVIRERVKERVRRVAKPKAPPAQPTGPDAAVAQRRDAFRKNPSAGNRRDVLKDFLRSRGAYGRSEGSPG